MLVRFLLAITTAFLASDVFFLALRCSRRIRLVTLLGLTLPILLAPLLICADARFLRFLASVACVMLLIKLWDVHLGGNLRCLEYAPKMFFQSAQCSIGERSVEI